MWNIYFKNCNLNFSHNRIVSRCRNYTAKHHWTSHDQVSALFTSQTWSFERILTTPGVTKIWKEVQWEKYAFLYTLPQIYISFRLQLLFFFKEEVYFNITKGSVLVFYLEALSTDLTSFQHSHWLSLLRCLLLQVKAKLMNNVRD